MATPQPGIFALGTRTHHHLEFDLRADATDSGVRVALARLREPAVTAGGANLVVGFGPELWGRLSPGECPEALVAFSPIAGADGTAAPSTQRDLWVWVHGTGSDIVVDVARAVAASLAPVASLQMEQACYVYRDSRDLTGFIDGTANPPVQDSPEVAVLAEGEPGAGGSFVLAQRWIHDLSRFAALPVSGQEAVFGRTKVDSRELEGAAKPADAHIARVEIHDAAGDERPIFRRSTPFASVVEAGLYFLAFSADPSRYAAMLGRMFDTTAEGLRDRLTDYSRPVTGSYFFAPSLEALRALAPVDDEAG